MAVTITRNPMLVQEKDSYRGIGIEGHYELGKGIVVDNVVAGSTAAKKLKLRAGDVVSTFNGEDIRYFTPSRVDKLGGQLRDAGLDHKPIALSVFRNGKDFKTTATRSKADVISSDGRQATRVGYGNRGSRICCKGHRRGRSCLENMDRTCEEPF